MGELNLSNQKACLINLNHKIIQFNNNLLKNFNYIFKALWNVLFSPYSAFSI